MQPTMLFTTCIICGRAVTMHSVCSSCERSAIQRNQLERPTLIKRVLSKFQ